MTKILQKLFGYDPKTMTLKREITGGITTFLTMAYILAVNPMVLGDAGMDKGAVFTATLLSAVIATLVMSMYAKMPFALAPAMGVNAFFAYTICGAMGYSWQFGLTAVFIEGVIFILLTVTGLRTYLVKALPMDLCNAISPGIGMFIALIGLHNSGIIKVEESSLPTLGDFSSTPVLLTCFGILLALFMVLKKINGGILLAIIITTIVGVPLGVTHFNGIFDTPPSLEPVMMKMQWDDMFSIDMFVCVFTLLFIDMFDTIGFLVGVCLQMGRVNEKGHIPGLNKGFMADAIGTTIGALLGTSTVTTVAESAAGINCGAKSGLASFFTVICLLLAAFFAPLFLSIPSQATAPALFLVGVMMMKSINKIDFSDLATATPCFVCMIAMPLTSSIANGIMLGLISYVGVNIFLAKWDKLNIGMYILAALFIAKYIFL